MNVALWCPACVEPLAAIDWAAREARCEPCGIAFALIGNLAPPRPVAGYPARLFAVRVAPGTRTTLRVEERGDERWFRHGGWLSLLSKSVIVAADRIELRTQLGARHVEPLANLRGFLPLQTIEWSGATPSVMTTSALATDTSLRKLFFHDTWDTALAVAATLNAAVDAVRLPAVPYR